jgi:hypothetical protein
MGEDTQETQQLPQNDNHDYEHKDDEEEGNKNEDDEDYTLLSDSKNDKVYHDADEIKTIRNEAPIPIGKLRDLLNRIDITTPPQENSAFRTRRVQGNCVDPQGT